MKIGFNIFHPYILLLFAVLHIHFVLASSTPSGHTNKASTEPTPVGQLKLADPQPPGCPAVEAVSEDPTAVFENDEVLLKCNETCTQLQANFTKTGGTDVYSVAPIPFAPPFPFTGGTALFVNKDDLWSDEISLPFKFCFYENTYNKIIVSANGAISFNTSLAGGFSCYSPTNPLPQPQDAICTFDFANGNPYHNSINGAYHDMDPTISGKISYGILGSPPCRTFVVNYTDVGHYLCPDLKTTMQIVLYESTNVIEVYLKEKPSCTGWEDGNAITGIQNINGTKGIAPPGRNATAWSVTDEAWRFTPSGTPSYEITWKNEIGQIIGSGEKLDVCLSEQQSESKNYTVDMKYTTCTGGEVLVSDDITVTSHLVPPCTASGGGEYELDETITLFGTGTGTYTWTGPNGFTSASQNPTIPNATFANSGDYVLQVVNGNCTSTAIVNVLVVEKGPDPLVLSATSKDNTNCNGKDCDYNGPSILINEVLMWPEGNVNGSLWDTLHPNYGLNESKGEWIELYNPNPCLAVDISCYMLGNNISDVGAGSGTYAGGLTIPPGTVVPPLGFAIIRGKNAPPVPSNQLVENGGNVVEVPVYGNITCIGPGGERLWFQDNGGWFAFYDNNGVFQDGISWNSTSGLDQRPCVKSLAGCSFSGALGSYNDAPSTRKKFLGFVTPPANYGNTWQRSPDGGAWITDQQRFPSYGVCNDNCTTPADVTCTGFATVQVSGGLEPFTYQWNDPRAQTTDTAFSLCPGTYCVTVTDAAGQVEQICVEVGEFEPEATLDNVGSVCENGGNITLSGSPVPSAGETGIYSGTGVSGNVFNPQIAGAGTHTVTYTYTTAFGCTDAASINIKVIDAVTILPQAFDICNGETIKTKDFGNNSPTIKYTWRVVAASSGVSGQTDQSTPTNFFQQTLTTTEPDGVVQYKVVGFIGNCASDSTTVIVNITNTSAEAGNYTVVNVGDNIFLFGSGGGSYAWTGPSGFSSPDQNPVRVNATFLHEGWYYLTTVRNGCPATDSVFVEVRDTDYSITADSVCAGDSIVFSVTGRPPLQVTGPNGFSTDTAAITLYDATEDMEGWYYVHAYDSIFDSTYVQVWDNPTTPTAGGPFTICALDSIELTATSTFETGHTGSFTWFPNNGAPTYTGNPYASGVLTLTSTYKIVAISERGCISDTGLATVNVTPLPPTPTVDNDTVCVVNASTLIASGSIGDYYWFHPDSGSTAIFIGDTFTTPVLAGPTFYIIQSLANGCYSLPDTAFVETVDRPVPPIAENDTICLGMDGALTGMATSIGRLFWFEQSSGGDFIFIGNTIPILAPDSTVDLFVQESIGSCATDRTAVSLVVTQPIYVTVTPDVTICSTDNLLVTAELSVDTITGTWTTTGDGVFTLTSDTSAFYSPGINDIINGTAELRYSLGDVDGDGPCGEFFNTLTVTIFEQPFVDFSAHLDSICAGESIHLTPLTSGDISFVQYTTLGDGTFDNAFTSATTYTPGANDVASREVKIALRAVGNAACVAYSDTLVLRINPVPQASFTYDAPSICSTDSLAIFYNGSDDGNPTFTWDFDSGTPAVAAPARDTFYVSYPNVSTWQSTSLTLTEYGCSTSFTDSILVAALPIAGVLSVKEDTICLGEQAQISIDGNLGKVTLQYSTDEGNTWTNIDTAGYINDSTFAVTVEQDKYVFRAIVTSGPCGSVTTDVIAVYAFLKAVGGTIVAYQDTICTFQSDSLFVFNVVGKIQWQKQQPNGTFVNIPGENKRFLVIDSLERTSSFRVKATVGQCPTDVSQPFTIVVNPASEAGVISAPTSICEGDSSTLSVAGIKGSVIDWYAVDGSGAFTSLGAAGRTTIPTRVILAEKDFAVIVKQNTCVADTAYTTVGMKPATIPGDIINLSEPCANEIGTYALINYRATSIRWFAADSGDVIFTEYPQFENQDTVQFLFERPTQIKVFVQNLDCKLEESFLYVRPTAIPNPGTIVLSDDTVCPGEPVTFTLQGYTGNFGGWLASSDGIVYQPTGILDDVYSIPSASYDVYVKAEFDNGLCASENSSHLVVLSDTARGSYDFSKFPGCYGDSVDITLTNRVGTITKWELSTNGGASYSTLNGFTDSVFTYDFLIRDAYFRTHIYASVCSETIVDTVLKVIDLPFAGVVDFDIPAACGPYEVTASLNSKRGVVERWETTVDGINYSLVPNSAGKDSIRFLADTNTFFKIVVSNGNCGEVISTRTFPVFDPSIGGTTTASVAQVCPGQDATITLADYLGEIIRWEVSTDGVSFSDYKNPGKETLEANNIRETSFFRAIVKNGVCDAVPSTLSQIVVDPVITPGRLNKNQFICKGETAALQLVNSSAGTTTWFQSTDGTNFTEITGVVGFNYNATPDVTTYYRVAIDGASCGTATSNLVTIQVAPQSNAGTLAVINDTICKGDDFQLWTTGFEGNIIGWESYVGNSKTSIASFNDTIQITNLTATRNFRVFAQSNTCTVDTSSIRIVVVNPPVPGVPSATSATICAGDSVNFSVTQTTAAINWLVSDKLGNFVATGVTGSTFQSSALDASTTYQAVVSNAYCPVATHNFVVTVNDSSAIDSLWATPAFICAGGSAGIRSVGLVGEVISWQQINSSGTIDLATLEPAFVSPDLFDTTTFVLTVQNGACPTTSDSVTVNLIPQPSLGNLNLLADSICLGDSVQVTIDNAVFPLGVTYYFSSFLDTTVLVGDASGIRFAPTQNGRLSIVAAAGNACAHADTAFNIYIDAPAQAGSIFNTTGKACVGDAIALQLSGTDADAILGWQFAYGADDFGDILFAGATSATVDSTSAFVRARAIVTRGVCPADTALITLTQDIPSSITRLSASPDTLCFGSEVELEVVPGAGNVMRWYKGATGGPLSSLFFAGKQLTDSPTQATDYVVEVKNGVCPSTFDTVTVHIGQPFVYDYPTQLCASERSLNFIFSANADYQLSFTMPSGKDSLVTLNAANNYALGVVPGKYILNYLNKGCKVTLDDTVFIHPTPTFSDSLVAITCNGEDNGAVFLADSGNLAPLTYSWKQLGNSGFNRSGAALTDLVAGTYVVTARISTYDICAAVDTFVVVEPEVLAPADLIASGPGCSTDISGRIALRATGGTLPYAFSFLKNGQSFTPAAETFEDSVYVEELPRASYRITVTDANGCSFAIDTALVNPPNMIATVTTENALCFGEISGSAKAVVTGGIPPYTFAWNDEDTNAVHPDTLGVGKYFLVVTDANACKKKIIFDIAEPAPVTYRAASNARQSICADSALGRLSASLLGGTAPYTLAWSNGESTAMIDSLLPGVYTLDVTDANGCAYQFTDTVVGVEHPNLSVMFSAPDCGDDTVAIQVTADIGTVAIAPLNPDDFTIIRQQGNDFTVRAGDYDNFVVSASANNQGCVSTVVSDAIVLKQQPIADFAFDGLLLGSSVGVRNFSLFADDYLWTVTGENLLSAGEEPLFTFPTDKGVEMEVCLHVSTDKGCEDNICKTYNFSGKDTVLIPNTFSPNGDGINDILLPVVLGADVANYQFDVYNRWGQLLFSTTSQSVGWDGRYKSNVVSNGIYVVVVNYLNNLNGETNKVFQNINKIE